MFPYKTPAEFSHALKSNSLLPSCPVATAISLLSGIWGLNIIYQLFVHDTFHFLYTFIHFMYTMLHFLYTFLLYI